MRSKLRFTKEEAYDQNCAISEFRRYMRSKLRFTKEEADFRKKHSMWPARYIRTFKASFEHERHPLGVSTLLCVFHLKRPEHILET